MLVVAVGTESEWGRTMALVATEAAPTPLQDALGVLATAIGKIGLAVGVICFLVLFARCGCRVEGLGLRVKGFCRPPHAFSTRKPLHGKCYLVSTLTTLRWALWMAPLAE